MRDSRPRVLQYTRGRVYAAWADRAMWPVAYRRHQDQCFFSPISDARPSPSDWSEMPPVITAWVPLMDATVETGCMQVMAPARPTLYKHYNANVSAPGTTIHPDHFPTGVRVVDVPTMIGDVLLFSAYAPHRSTENTAGVMRWAADLRYNVPEAGNYYPGEGGFLGRSSNPATPAVTDWREYVHLRNSHEVDQAAAEANRALGGRQWKVAADETFAMPMVRHELEGPLEFEGRVAAVQEREAQARL